MYQISRIANKQGRFAIGHCTGPDGVYYCIVESVNEEWSYWFERQGILTSLEDALKEVERISES